MYDFLLSGDIQVIKAVRKLMKLVGLSDFSVHRWFSVLVLMISRPNV